METDFVPEYTEPAQNRRVILASRPVGVPLAKDFAIETAAIPAPGDGQILVRNIYLSVDPAQRGWAIDGTSYAPPVPIGAVMRSLAVGVIVASRHADFAAGEFVYGWLGWQDYAAIGTDQVVTRIPDPQAPLSAYAGVLGMNGLTAAIAFETLSRAREGDTVLVSTAAGAVGSAVGQIAREAGCRTLGLAGSDAKVARCTERFGYDAAANYKSAPLPELLRALAPDGIDIFYDNVGGPTLDAALRHMRGGGRIIQCGTASVTAWSPPPQGPRNEREVLLRRVSWSGFSLFDHRPAFPAALERLTEMVRDGALVYDEDITVGIEAVPDAIRAVYAGENEGKKLIFLG